MRIEVFKTNVVDRDMANWLIDKIHSRFNYYQAGFDLEDCDRILVVKCITGTVEPSHIIDLLKGFDYNAEVLPDE